MTIRETLANSQPGQWLMIRNPSRGHRMMSGIALAGISHDGLLRAMYEDGTERTKQAPDSILELSATPEDFTLLSVASALSSHD